MAWAHAVHPETSVTVEEYLRLESLAEERHEYLDGMISAMAGESPDHGRICVNLTIALGAQLRHAGCEVFSKDLRSAVGHCPRVRARGGACLPIWIWWSCAVPSPSTPRRRRFSSIRRS